MAKPVAAGRNTMMIPDDTPPRESGNVTLKNVFQGGTPRSLLASISERSIFSSTVYIGKIINGRYVVTVTKMTAEFVPIRFKALSPSVENNLNHDTILSMEFDHIGMISRSSKSILFFSFENEIK